MAPAQVAEKIHAHLEGDVSGQVAVGSHNLQIGSMHGGIVQIIEKEQQPVSRRRPSPVLLRPRPFKGLLDRKPQVASAVKNAKADTPIEFYGESGIGKSSLLHHLANCAPLSQCPDGLIFLAVRRRSADEVLQSLFDAFYETDIPFKASDAQLRHTLRDVRALIVLDDVALPRDELQTVMDVAPQCRFLLASDERRLWGQGRAEELGGLPPDDALVLLERELDRPLASEERPAAQQLCSRAQGHPLRLMQLAALVRQGAHSLAELADQLQSPADAETITLQSIKQLPPAHRRLLAALAAAGDVHLPTELLATLAKLPNAEAVLQSLERDGFVKSGSPRYRLAGNLQRGFRARMDVAKGQRQVVAALATWAESRRDQPGRLLEEADAVLHCAEAAARAGAWPGVLRLTRALDDTLALGKRWDAWERMLQHGLEAAQRLQDQAAEAWALHQYGTRALCLDEASTATRYLHRALEIREALGDVRGAEITRHNLSLLKVPPPEPPGPDPDPPSPNPNGGSGGSPILPWGISGILSIGMVAVLVWSFVGPGHTPPIPEPLPVPTLQALNLERDAVQGGESLEAKVLLSHPALAEGAPIDLRSNNSEAARIDPPTFRIEAGATYAQFLIQTNEVSEETEVEVTASYAGLSKHATLHVRAPPPVLAGVRMDSETVSGGQIARGTLLLNRAAPQGGVEIGLESDVPEIAAVQKTVVVPGGQTQAEFALKTAPLARAQRVTVAGTLGATTQSATLRILPIPLESVVVAPRSVVGGESARATATLAEPAPQDGMTIALRCDTTAVASIQPASVTIPEGQRSATFDVLTKQVPALTSIVLIAADNEQSQQTVLELRPPLPHLVSVRLQADSAMGQKELNAEVRLSGPAPDGGVNVELQSSAPELATVGNAVSVAAGQDKAEFVVHTKRVSSPRTIVLTANCGDRNETAELQLLPWPALASLGVEPARIVAPGQSNGVLKLTGPAPDDGIVVEVNSRDNQIATLAPNVTVPPGTSEVRFPIQVRSIRAPTEVVIEATYDGRTQRATLQVDAPLAPLRLVEMRLPTDPVVGGERADGAIRLNRPATEQVTITLAGADDVSFLVDGRRANEVVVPAGEDRASIQINTNPVERTTRVRVSASLPDQQALAESLVLLPPLRVRELELDPNPVEGGQRVRGTVRLNRTALRDVKVTISSNASPAQLVVANRQGRSARSRTSPQATVTIREGAERATFSIATDVVDRDASVKIDASLEGQTAVRRDLRVTARPVRLVDLRLTRQRVFGGTTLQAHVRLDRATPDDVRVGLVSEPAMQFLVDRASSRSVTIRGTQQRASFEIATPRVTQRTEVKITAFRSREEAISQTLTLEPVPLRLVELRLEPSRLEGGGPVRGTVRLNEAALVPVRVFLSSNRHFANFVDRTPREPRRRSAIPFSKTPPQLSPTLEVVIPPRADSAPFLLATQAVPGPTAVEIRAALAEQPPLTETLELFPPPIRIKGVSVLPAQVIGGGKVRGLVALDRAAPVPITVDLFASDPRVRFAVGHQLVHAVKIPPGAVVAPFDVIHPRVGTKTAVMIGASLDTQRQSTLLLLMPLRLDKLDWNHQLEWGASHGRIVR